MANVFISTFNYVENRLFTFREFFFYGLKDGLIYFNYFKFFYWSESQNSKRQSLFKLSNLIIKLLIETLQRPQKAASRKFEEDISQEIGIAVIMLPSSAIFMSPLKLKRILYSCMS